MTWLKRLWLTRSYLFLYSMSNEIERTNMMNKVYIGVTLTLYKVVSKNSIKREKRSIDATTNQNARIDQMIWFILTNNKIITLSNFNRKISFWCWHLKRWKYVVHKLNNNGHLLEFHAKRQMKDSTLLQSLTFHQLHPSSPRQRCAPPRITNTGCYSNQHLVCCQLST